MELGSEPSLPAPEAKREFVREMFDRIAPRYDLLNRLITLGMDQRWRRAAIAMAAIRPGDRVLDLAAGTGDFLELARAAGARAIGLDFAAGMLRHARTRLPGAPLVRGDALALPFRDASLDAITCGFALRNFTDLEQVIAECARVLVGGGRLALLEVDEPRSRLLRLGHRLHFRTLVPRLGALLSDAAAYRYLPASASYLPPEPELRACLERMGLGEVRKQRLLLGAVQLVCATRGAR